MADAFIGWLASIVPAVEAELARRLPDPETPPERLHAALGYAVLGGGKRLRPALVLLAGESFGAARELLLPGAAAVEMIHTYSLVHDDLPALDDDDLRRGRATTHRQFDEATAILAGDALLTHGLGLLAADPRALSPEIRRRAVELVAEAIGTLGMIGGQMADVEAEHAWPPDPAAALELIHRRKTGALLGACLRLGGLYAEAGSRADAALAAFGESIGLMFQIADDILDVVGTSRRLGKTAGKDAGAHKLTYPAVHGLAASRVELARLRDQALAQAAELPDERGLFAALVRFSSTRDH